MSSSRNKTQKNQLNDLHNDIDITDAAKDNLEWNTANYAQRFKYTENFMTFSNTNILYSKLSLTCKW